MGMEGSYSGGCGMTPAEAILTTDRDRGYDDGMFGGGFMWVFFLFFLLAWGNGGWGGFGNNGSGVATNADVQRGFDNQSVMNKLNGLENGLCDGFYAMNTGLLNGFNGIQRDLCTGFNGVNQNINQARFESQQCCCETNRNIDAVRYENARNTCDIVNAIKEDGAATRALITQNEMQALRDQLQTANFQLSQQAQNATLIRELRPCPIPAYLTCSPYAAYGYNGCGFNSGCGCGC